MTHDAETLVMFAARRAPRAGDSPGTRARRLGTVRSLHRCDYAYRGGGHGVATERIAELERWIHGDCRPDLTFLFDVPTAVSHARLSHAAGQGRDLDKFEREADGFFTRVRDAYLARAAADPQRFRVIDGTRPVVVVRGEIAAHLAAIVR